MYYKIFQTCLFTKGIKRAIMFDSQRHCFFIIPNSMVDFVIAMDGSNVKTYLSKFHPDDKEVVTQYIEFLLEKEVIFYVNSRQELNYFPEIDLSWKSPFKISNAIIELDCETMIANLTSFLNNQYFDCIQFYLFFNRIEKKEFVQTLLKLTKIQSKSKQILFKNETNFSLQDLIEICDLFPNIECLVAYSSSEKKYYVHNGTIISMINQNNLSCLYCGLIDAQYYNLQLNHYTESLAHNTCLNRKIAIDTEGNIKNCPSMKESFGNIKDTTLEEAINKPGFKKYWNITKDQISKCKDCEFRHVCTDCRAYVENPEDIYAAPLKCGYDPYTCEWEEWSENPLKQQAIEYYGMKDIIKTRM